MSDYALERALADNLKRSRSRTKNSEPGNIPSELRSARVEEKIHELLGLGLDSAQVTSMLLDWNQSQPSPMSEGEVKKRLFLASSKTD